MAHAPQSELPDLLDWLTSTIEPVQGQQWQITLNSSGDVVEAEARITESKRTNERGHRMTITRVENVRFRLGRRPDRRAVFSTD